jgi:hypothetical protein
MVTESDDVKALGPRLVASMPRRFALCMLVLWSVLVPAFGQAQPVAREAHRLFTRGLAEHRAGSFGAAASAFKRAFELTPRPDYLYAWAQAERLGGNCAVAVPLYQRLLALHLPASRREAAERGISLCQLAAPPPIPAPAPVARPAPVEPPAPVAAPKPAAVLPGAAVRHPAPGRAWYADPWAGGLLALGVASVGAGAGCFVLASAAERSARDAATYPDHERWADRAQSRRLAAWISVGLGGGLLVAAAVRYALRRRSSRVSIGFAPLPAGLALVVGGGTPYAAISDVGAGPPGQ